MPRASAGVRAFFGRVFDGEKAAAAGARRLRAVGAYVALMAMLTVCSLPAQPAGDNALAPSPAFGDTAAGIRADEAVALWNRWAHADRGLEARLSQLPMADARDELARSLGRFQDFLDSRAAYACAIEAAIDIGTAARGSTAATRVRVSSDHIAVLAAAIAAVEDRLRLLQSSPQWLEVRRGARAGLEATLGMQSDLRAGLLRTPADRSEAPAEVVPARVYREGEARLADSLERLWSGYYSALAAAVEGKTAGAAALVAIRGDNALPLRPRTPSHAMAGVWVYLEGSRLFNGAGEPHQVLLELWAENGEMRGRYRAQLPGLRGRKNVDVRLRGSLATTGPLRLQIEPAGSGDIAGQILLEGPAANGALSLTREVPAHSGLPRGREILLRR
jgi:hypothetical protein